MILAYNETIYIHLAYLGKQCFSHSKIGNL